MSQPPSRIRADIEEFMRSVVRDIEAAESIGITAPADLADHFNARGLTTRKGRPWSAATMTKFLSSPAAQRLRRVKS